MGEHQFEQRRGGLSLEAAQLSFSPRRSHVGMIDERLGDQFLELRMITFGCPEAILFLPCTFLDKLR